MAKEINWFGVLVGKTYASLGLLNTVANAKFTIGAFDTIFLPIKSLYNWIGTQYPTLPWIVVLLIIWVLFGVIGALIFHYAFKKR